MSTFMIGLCKLTYRGKNQTDISCPSVDFVVNNKKVVMNIKSKENVSVDGTRLIIVEEDIIINKETKEELPSNKNTEITKITKQYGPDTDINVKYDIDENIERVSIYSDGKCYMVNTKIEIGGSSKTVTEQWTSTERSEPLELMHEYIENLFHEKKKEELANKFKNMYGSKKGQ